MQLYHICTMPKQIVKQSWDSGLELKVAAESKGRHEFTEKPKASENIF